MTAAGAAGRAFEFCHFVSAICSNVCRSFCRREGERLSMNPDRKTRSSIFAKARFHPSAGILVEARD